MKNEQKLQARELYFTATLNKSEIAEQVGVNRRTIMLWAREGNWQKQRDLDRQLPALLEERSYELVDSFTSGLLNGKPTDLNTKDAETVYFLASGIHKLQGKPDEAKRREIFSSLIKKVGTKRRNRTAA